MSFTNQTTHYGLPQWIGSDKPTYLVDQNNAYQTIDSEIYNANVTAGEAVTTANGASSTAGAASATAADALSAAQTASTTADSALSEAQTANTNAQAAQTAAGAAQTAAQAAQEAAAGNSITNLAPAYDSTITYAIDDLVTQDGKLYKCIVAVVTPEQFDINKWDDVTASEVFLKGGNGYLLLSRDSVSRTSLSTESFRTWLNAFYNDVKTYLNSLDATLYYTIECCVIVGQEHKAVSTTITSVRSFGALDQNVIMITRINNVYKTLIFRIRETDSGADLVDMSDGSTSTISTDNVGDTINIRFQINVYKKL